MHIEPLIKINLCRVGVADLRIPFSHDFSGSGVRGGWRAHSAGRAVPSSQGLQCSAEALTPLSLSLSPPLCAA